MLLQCSPHRQICFQMKIFQGEQSTMLIPQMSTILVHSTNTLMRNLRSSKMLLLLIIQFIRRTSQWSQQISITSLKLSMPIMIAGLTSSPNKILIFSSILLYHQHQMQLVRLIPQPLYLTTFPCLLPITQMLLRINPQALSHQIIL